MTYKITQIPGTYAPQTLVAKMMRAFGQEVRSTPTLPGPEERLLRARLILEEALETIVKGLGVSLSVAWGDEQHLIHDIHDLHLKVTGPGDIVQVADGTADLKVVTYGTDNACGINAAEVFDEVMDSNMSKVGVDGSVVRDTHGKVVKPSFYHPPNIIRALGLARDAE